MKTFAIQFLVLIVLLFSCSKDDQDIKSNDQDNSTIDSTLRIEPGNDSLVVGSIMKLICKSDIISSDDLEYAWSSEDGEFGYFINGKFVKVDTINSNMIYWKAPYQSGTFNIHCIAYNSQADSQEIASTINVYRPVYNNISTVYISERLINDLVNINEDVICTFNLPFFNSSLNSKLVEDELLSISDLSIEKKFNISLYDYWYDYSSSWIADTLEDKIGSRLFESQINIEYLNNYLYVASYKNENKINLINIANESNVAISFMGYRVLDLKSNNKNELFLITSPRFENLNMNTPPIIWKMTENFQIQKIFEFPSTYDYSGADYGDGYPLSIKYDMAFDSDNNLYVAMPYTEKIFKLDKNNNLTVFIDDIFCPSSIEIAKNGFIYIVSSAGYTKVSDDWQLTKPLQIYLIDEEGKRSIISEMQTDYLRHGGSLRLMNDGVSYLLSSTIQNGIILKSNFDLYFIDSHEGYIKVLN